MIRLEQPRWFAVVSGGIVLCGMFLVAASWRTERRALALPRMTSEELLRKGGAAPQFVTLTDIHICQNGFAFRRDMDAATEMYVPAFSTTLKEEPPAANLRLLLEVLDHRESDRLLGCRVPGELTVELWTDARMLAPWIEDTLVACYPGIRLTDCRVLSVGLHEPSLARARRELHNGFALLALAIVSQAGWLVWQYFRTRNSNREGVSTADFDAWLSEPA